jgi:transcription elongation factor Elf1
VKELRKLIEKTIGAFSSARLFSSHPKIYFKPEERICPICNTSLKVMKTEDRTMITLHIGKFTANITFLICRNCENKATYVSHEPQTLVPEYCNFGFDVLVDVGKNVFQKYKTAKEIRHELQNKNIFISDSEVYFLTKKFITYLGLAHRESGQEIRKFMKKNGGYILHIDGTCDGGSQHLITVIDAISGFVLDSIKISTENSSQIIPMLQRLKKTYGDPLAVVSDMGTALILALMTVFKNTPHFICHFHFLRDIGKDLIMDDYSVIQKQLKAYRISTKLQNRIRSYEKDVDLNTEIINQLASILETDNSFSYSLISSSSIKIICHVFLLWAFKGKSQGNGYGFPFDRQHLIFYQRLNIVYTSLKEITETYPKKEKKDIKPAQQLLIDLEPLVNDKLCKDIVPNMVEKIDVFDKLRDAMHIALPNGKDGLNDNGDDVGIKTIGWRVKKFTIWLMKKYSNNKDYKGMIEQIEKYWEKLFADPITTHTPSGEIEIQPQRTNNIMEQFFRRLKKIFLRKSGINSMSETLRTMFVDIPLIENLENSDYMKILLNGRKTLEERFAEIDAESVRKEMKKNCNLNKKNSGKIQTIINDVKFPERLTNIFKLRLAA